MRDERINLQSVITSKWGAFFIILPYVKPASEITGFFDTFFDLWKMLAAVLIIIGCFEQINKISKVLIPISALQIVMLVATVINKGDLKAGIVQVLSNISICIYFDYFFQLNPKRALKYISLPLVTMSILTAASMYIYYPNGMYSVSEVGNEYIEKGNYLWGFDNSSIFNFVPAMYMVGLYSFLSGHKRIKRYVVILFLFVSFAFLYVFSLTAFLGCFAITFAYVGIVVKNYKMKICTTRNMVSIGVLSSMALLIGKEKLSALMAIATNTDKYYSIKFRFHIWNSVIKWWKKCPLIGYGIEKAVVIKSKIILDHPHNYFMDVLYRGGIVGVCCTILILYIIMKKSWKDIRINMFSGICFFVIFMIAQFDYYNDHYLFYPTIMLILYSSKFVQKNDLRMCIRYKTYT